MHFWLELCFWVYLVLALVLSLSCCFVATLVFGPQTHFHLWPLVFVLQSAFVLIKAQQCDSSRPVQCALQKSSVKINLKTWLLSSKISQLKVGVRLNLWPIGAIIIKLDVQAEVGNRSTKAFPAQPMGATTSTKIIYLYHISKSVLLTLTNYGLPSQGQLLTNIWNEVLIGESGLSLQLWIGHRSIIISPIIMKLGRYFRTTMNIGLLKRFGCDH